MSAELVHPRVKSRELKAPVDDRVRVVVHTHDRQREIWIEAELSRLEAVVQHSRTGEHVVSALVEDPPPRPQVLVLDVDSISPGELLELHAIRERGWCGRIIGLGVVPAALRSSLGVERVLNTPLTPGLLADAIDEIGFGAQTRRIPVMDAQMPAEMVRTRVVG